MEKIENEQHFLLECPLYNTLRHDFIEKVESHCSNSSSLNNSSKFIWLLTNENLTVLKELGSYISKRLEIRRLREHTNHYTTNATWMTTMTDP